MVSWLRSLLPHSKLAPLPAVAVAASWTLVFFLCAIVPVGGAAGPKFAGSFASSSGEADLGRAWSTWHNWLKKNGGQAPRLVLTEVVDESGRLEDLRQPRSCLLFRPTTDVTSSDVLFQAPRALSIITNGSEVDLAKLLLKHHSDLSSPLSPWMRLIPVDYWRRAPILTLPEWTEEIGSSMKLRMLSKTGGENVDSGDEGGDEWGGISVQGSWALSFVTAHAVREVTEDDTTDESYGALVLPPWSGLFPLNWRRDPGVFSHVDAGSNNVTGHSGKAMPAGSLLQPIRRECWRAAASATEAVLQMPGAAGRCNLAAGQLEDGLEAALAAGWLEFHSSVRLSQDGAAFAASPVPASTTIATFNLASFHLGSRTAAHTLGPIPADLPGLFHLHGITGTERQWMQREMVALQLLLEIVRPESGITLWGCTILARNASRFPLLWEKKRLKAMGVEDEVEGMRKNILKSWNRIMPSLFHVYGPDGTSPLAGAIPDAFFHPQSWVWAMWVTVTQGFWHDGHLYLVPYSDMFRHRASAPSRVLGRSNESEPSSMQIMSGAEGIKYGAAIHVNHGLEIDETESGERDVELEHQFLATHGVPFIGSFMDDLN